MKKVVWVLVVALIALCCTSCKEKSEETSEKKEVVKEAAKEALNEVVYEKKDYAEKIVGTWSLTEMMMDDKAMSTFTDQDIIFEKDGTYKSKEKSATEYDNARYWVKTDTFNIGSTYRIVKMTDKMMKTTALNTPDGIAVVSFIYRRAE